VILEGPAASGQAAEKCEDRPEIGRPDLHSGRESCQSAIGPTEGWALPVAPELSESLRENRLLQMPGVRERNHDDPEYDSVNDEDLQGIGLKITDQPRNRGVSDDR
jgi:hypothetical protein